MKRFIIYVFLFISLLLSLLIINILNNYFSDRVAVYIQNRGIVYTQNYIHDAIMDSVIKEIDISSMYLFKEDTNQKINSVLINTAQVNKILALVNDSLDTNIISLQEEKIKIPFTTIIGETIFSNIAPDVKLRIIPIGNFKCDIISEVKQYGINNSLFEIYIQVDLKIESLVPLQKIESNVKCKIPIVMQIIQGEVPRYYYNTSQLVPDVYDNNLQ